MTSLMRVQASSRRVARRVARRSRVRHHSLLAPPRALARADAIWPPTDVFDEFATKHVGVFRGARASFVVDGASARASATGAAYASKTSWTPTRTCATDCSICPDRDGVYFVTRDDDEETTSGARGDETRRVVACANGQMGKMFIAQGCFADGPLVLPQCVEGEEITFAFAFVEETHAGERWRVDVRARASPTKRRRWTLSSIDVAHEVRGESALGVNDPSQGDVLRSEALIDGEWRASSGATFIALEALDERADESGDGRRAGNGNNERAQSDSRLGPAQAMAKKKPEDAALARAAEAESRAERASAMEAADARETPPEGLIVVPWWAVKSRSSWAQSGEYVLGGNSPLVFLPHHAWVLLESIDDQVVIECGRYPDGPPRGDADVDDTVRRVIARRYRHGRFASAFFVEERRLSRAERENENEDFDVLEGFDDDDRLASEL